MEGNNQNEVFVGLIRNEVFEKLSVDDRAKEPLKRVLERIQKYFDIHGYTSQVNYEEMLNKYLVPKDNVSKEQVKNEDEYTKHYNEMLAHVEQIAKDLNLEISGKEKDELLDRFMKDKPDIEALKIEVSDFLSNKAMYNKQANLISISSSLLNDKHLDEALCHQFLCFLTMCGEMEYGSIVNDMKPVIFEALTEIITQDIMNENNRNRNYDSWCELMEFVNKLAGVKDYSSFLMRKIDEKYDNDWLKFFEEAQNIFDSKLTGQLLNQNDMVMLQKKAFECIKKDLEKNINDVDKYTEILSRLKNAPNIYLEQEYVNNFIEEAIKAFMQNQKRDDKEVMQNIKDLIEVQEKLGYYDSKDVHEVSIEGVTYAFDSEQNVYYNDGNGKTFNMGKDNDKGVVNNLDDNKIEIYTTNGYQEFDLSKIDFGARTEEILQDKERLVKIINESLTKSAEIQSPDETEEKIKEIVQDEYSKDFKETTDEQDLRRKQFEERAKAMGLDLSEVPNLDDLIKQQTFLEQLGLDKTL